MYTDFWDKVQQDESTNAQADPMKPYSASFEKWNKGKSDGSKEKEDHSSPDAHTLAAVHVLQINILGGDGDISGDMDDRPGPKKLIEASIKDWTNCTIGSSKKKSYPGENHRVQQIMI